MTSAEISPSFRIGTSPLRVPDLDAAVPFHAEFLGLTETERHGQPIEPLR